MDETEAQYRETQTPFETDTVMEPHKDRQPVRQRHTKRHTHAPLNRQRAKETNT